MEALRTASSWVMYAGMAVVMYGGAQWPRPLWAAVGGGLAVIGVGVAMKRAAGAPAIEVEVGGNDRRPARAGSLGDALTALREGIDELSGRSGEASFDEVKRRIEELLWLGPERVGGAQEGIAAKIGFAAYAEVMTPLAAAERWLNRAWSAAADGHRPECVASLKEALSFAQEAESIGKERLSAL